jgi:hypothetical protein
MQLQGSRNQQNIDDALDFSTTITGAPAQIVVPQQLTRSYLFFHNPGPNPMTLDFGHATATAALTGSAVTSVTGVNNGVGYLVIPQVQVLGGLRVGDLVNNPGTVGGRIATVTVNSLSSGAINGYTVNDGGTGYVVAPTIILVNPAPNLGGGCRVPTALNGIVVVSKGSFVMENTFCTTGAIAVIGTAADPFICKVKVF